MFLIPNDWASMLKMQSESQYFKDLQKFVENEYANNICYPPKDKIFEAFRLTSYEQTKVVILGQDPYHGEGQAQGFCFSVAASIAPPPSLVNIFKAMDYDLGSTKRKNGDLTYLAKQGVLLLNSTLTVRQGRPQSHAGKGWETFTDSVIKLLNDSPNPIVFMLWGGYAKSKASLITNKRHLVLTAVHPSPLSFYMGFLECRHFSKANTFLTNNNISPICWTE